MLNSNYDKNNVHTTPYVIKQKTGLLSVILKNLQELSLLKCEVPAENKRINKKNGMFVQLINDEPSECMCVCELSVFSSQNHGAL